MPKACSVMARHPQLYQQQYSSVSQWRQESVRSGAQSQRPVHCHCFDLPASTRPVVAPPVWSLTLAMVLWGHEPVCSDFQGVAMCQHDMTPAGMSLLWKETTPLLEAPHWVGALLCLWVAFCQASVSVGMWVGIEQVNIPFTILSCYCYHMDYIQNGFYKGLNPALHTHWTQWTAGIPVEEDYPCAQVAQLANCTPRFKTHFKEKHAGIWNGRKRSNTNSYP